LIACGDAESGGFPANQVSRSRSRGWSLSNHVYKIVEADAWQKAMKQGVFHGSDVDLRDGFIHFSAAHQVHETLKKHFQGKRNLFLLVVRESDLADALTWEVSRGGALFPHLYRDLSIDEVCLAQPIDEDNLLQWPGEE
jgi:uncharacterized protein (DUF952 family)